jgi:hypothetical protein
VLSHQPVRKTLQPLIGHARDFDTEVTLTKDYGFVLMIGFDQRGSGALIYLCRVNVRNVREVPVGAYPRQNSIAFRKYIGDCARIILDLNDRACRSEKVFAPASTCRSCPSTSIFIAIG